MESVNDEQGEKALDPAEEKKIVVTNMQQSVMSGVSEEQSVYSVSNHFKAAHRNQMSKKKSNKAKTEAEDSSKHENQELPAPSQSRGEKNGTSKKEEPVVKELMHSQVSTVKEAIDETDSEARKSSSQFNLRTKDHEKDISHEQNVGQTTAFSDNVEPTIQENTVDY